MVIHSLTFLRTTPVLFTVKKMLEVLVSILKRALYSHQQTRVVVCVCVCVCVFVCFLFVCLFVYVHVCVHVCVWVWVHVGGFVCLRGYTGG
jgi:hypothetical protein